jgi:hypothetical protein
MTDLPIDHYRLETVRLGLEKGLLLSEIGRLVALVETGTLPTLETVAQAIANGHDDAPSPALRERARVRAAAPSDAAPDRGQAAAPGPPAIAHALDRQAEPLPVAAQPATRRGYRLADLPRWTEERKALLHQLMAPHEPPYHRITWHAFAEKINLLPGPPLSGTQVRDWWAKVGSFQRERERHAHPAH